MGRYVKGRMPVVVERDAWTLASGAEYRLFDVGDWVFEYPLDRESGETVESQYEAALAFLAWAEWMEKEGE